MNQLEVIQYLLNEIRIEQRYNTEYPKQLQAIRERNNGETWSAEEQRFDKTHRPPRYEARVKENCKLIRRLALELSKGE